MICDSVNIKTEAFVEMYQPYGTEIQEKVEAYHLMHGGYLVSKNSDTESHLLGNKVNEAKINDLASRFSALVKEKVIAAKYIPGAFEFISKNKYKDNLFAPVHQKMKFWRLLKRKN